MKQKRFILDESELPRQWYNIQAEMINKPMPLLNPATKEPLNADDLAHIFAAECARQELDMEHAWIDIPDSDVSYPILRSPNDNAYYLTHDSLKKKNTKGALFTEDYNTMTFDDPMTVIYGHTTRDGSLFGKLQENYSSKEYFDAHRTI